jgi:hypothetical protein
MRECNRGVENGREYNRDTSRGQCWWRREERVRLIETGKVWRGEEKVSNGS